jgi:hypothetical protein
VRLALQEEQIRIAIDATDNQGISGVAKRALFAALAAAIGSITVGGATIPTYTLLELADAGRAELLREYLDETRAELAARIRRRSDSSSTATSSTDDRPAAFGSKN